MTFKMKTVGFPPFFVCRKWLPFCCVPQKENHPIPEDWVVLCKVDLSRFIKTRDEGAKP